MRAKILARSPFPSSLRRQGSRRADLQRSSDVSVYGSPPSRGCRKETRPGAEESDGAGKHASVAGDASLTKLGPSSASDESRLQTQRPRRSLVVVDHADDDRPRRSRRGAARGPARPARPVDRARHGRDGRRGAARAAGRRGRAARLGPRDHARAARARRPRAADRPALAPRRAGRRHRAGQRHGADPGGGGDDRAAAGAAAVAHRGTGRGGDDQRLDHRGAGEILGRPAAARAGRPSRPGHRAEFSERTRHQQRAGLSHACRAGGAGRGRARGAQLYLCDRDPADRDDRGEPRLSRRALAVGRAGGLVRRYRLGGAVVVARRAAAALAGALVRARRREQPSRRGEVRRVDHAPV